HTFHLLSYMSQFFLRSRWHRIASSQIMLITVTGRKTGKQYTTPVNYAEDEEFEAGGTLSVISHKHRTWWRNLRGGQPVTIYLRGIKHAAFAEVVEEGEEVAELLHDHLIDVPQFAEPLDVGLDEDEVPIWEDVLESAAGKVMVIMRRKEEEWNTEN
ncbi:nitroreductase family deazaflavin-dependent oxidoreductase, partial [Chloroflexi bacterium TSY]|nr:nitroreductase family deazaflavin-dependent oxidoreductase [Chloroflexi bacterium TSY]